MSNGHGGKRKGAGRPKGAKTRITEEAIAKVGDEGITPLEYMLNIMRDSDADERRRDDMAKAAAPYIHAKKIEADINVNDAHEERLAMAREKLNAARQHPTTH